MRAQRPTGSILGEAGYQRQTLGGQRSSKTQTRESSEAGQGLGLGGQAGNHRGVPHAE